jgi:NAD(P)H-hydrate repair Nnr-like enzyme with NAD(P)H-hydrate epimerase domain
VVAVTDVDPAVVSRALIVWTGWGTSSWPLRDDTAIDAVFGVELAPALRESIRSLEEDFYSSNARLTVPDTDTMAAVAAAEFRERHPEIPEEAVRALAWCYAFDYK